MKAKWSLSHILLSSAVLLASFGCHRHAPLVAPERVGSGYQWLGWSSGQRQLYVEGYLDGQGTAQMNLCHDLESSFERERVADSVVLKPEESPCVHFRRQYSHRSVGGLDGYTRDYVSVIDGFYKHPECRMMPYAMLMEHLDDTEYQSGEAMFQMVHRGGAGWGFFSGLDGMESCMGLR